jgi:SDR family mycofactocin-dependent oxidoreductase
MGRLDGKVALITGAARGQGRSHAVRLGQEGARIVAVDLCESLKSPPYDGATEADLAETVRLVEEQDQRALAVKADVRDLSALEGAVAQGMSEFGRLDVVVANAGIAHFGELWSLTEGEWQEMIDINLTGVWKTLRATAPTLIEQGQGGSIILTSSIAGLIAYPMLGHYCAAKHGVTGLMRVATVELGQHNIRVNSVHPTTVMTPMIDNEPVYSLFLGLESGGSREIAAEGLKNYHALPIPWVEAVDISNVVLFLASDESRFITGTTQVVDAGASHPFKIPNVVPG